MSADLRCHFHLETPAAGATLPQGRHLLRGWVWPESNNVLVDVRARIGSRLFAGIHGFPRADLAAHFKIGRPVALAGFEIVVEVAPSSVEITLEALEISGRWSAFHRFPLSVVPANPPAQLSLPAGPLRWIDHGHGLKQLLHTAVRRPDQPLASLAAQLADELPWPRVLRDAPAPLLGFVDEPASVCRCHFGRIPAFGHLFHPTLLTRRILATVDLQSWQPLALHQPSPGPAAHYAHYANAQTCGFLGLVDVPAQLPNPVSLRLYAELEDGSLHLGPVVRTRLHTAEAEKIPFSPLPPVLFDAALSAWENALAARQLPVTRDADLDRYLAALRGEHTQSSRARSLQPAPPPHPTPTASARPFPRRIILATHGLSLQGAPRFLLELARGLVHAGAQLHVISPEDGPLRAEFAALGAAISIIDATALMRAETAIDAASALVALSVQPEWRAADLVIANSFTTFWAVHAAKTAARPVLFYIHESTSPKTFYEARASAAVVALVEQAFALADAISFTTAATRDCHLSYGRPERHYLTPGWVDLTLLDTWRAAQNRETLRQSLGVQPGELLVCNIGTVSDRKGQHTFARAVDLLWRRRPEIAARTRFILLGGRTTPFDTMLGDTLTELNRANLIVHPETSDYLRYYLAADLFVCSSYEESSPRVVFEAMALGAPILATTVQGIPELVRNGQEAVLLPAGDTLAWCDGLAHLLTAPDLRAQLAARARARAETHFSATAILPQHLTLAATVVHRA